MVFNLAGTILLWHVHDEHWLYAEAFINSNLRLYPALALIEQCTTMTGSRPVGVMYTALPQTLHQHVVGHIDVQIDNAAALAGSQPFS
jgi:hypothetical protein